MTSKGIHNCPNPRGFGSAILAVLLFSLLLSSSETNSFGLAKHKISRFEVITKMKNKVRGLRSYYHFCSRDNQSCVLLYTISQKNN